MNFKNLGLDSELLAAIEKMNIYEPTQIQAEGIPPIMQGKDVIGESATGSGKTLAFGCGILKNVVPGDKLQALVLTPTRELAEQVKKNLAEMSKGRKLNILSIYGGVSINPQIDKLKNTNIVVATPGRLLDHMQRGTINLSKIKILVLDEADRMLDMGFIDDVRDIMRECPKKRQTLFFSATISPFIERLAEKHMKNPVKVSAVKQVDPSKLQQVLYNIPNNIKLSLLIHLLKNENTVLAMVFCNTRRSTDLVMRNLKANKVKAVAIHGGMSQRQRDQNLDSFNSGKTNILVCTDVAARGLHIDNVSHVYNYGIPQDPVDYIHRIGRTARAGEEGKVINLLVKEDYSSFFKISENYKFEIEELPVPNIERVQMKTNLVGKRDEKRYDKTPRRKGGNRGPRRSNAETSNSRPRRGSDRGPRRDSDSRGRGRDSDSRGPRRNTDSRGPRKSSSDSRGSRSGSGKKTGMRSHNKIFKSKRRRK